MADSITQHGVGYNWGSDIASTGFGTSYTVENYTVDSKGNRKMIIDSVGNYSGYAGFQHYKEFKGDFIPTSVSGTTSASITLPAIDSMITITSTTDPLVTGSNWIVQDVSLNGKCDDFKKYNITLWSTPNITS